MREKRFVALCADDYAINSNVSEAILSLIDKQRITAVSCMTDSDCWKKYGDKLKIHNGKVDMGLHLNLTENILIRGKTLSIFEFLLRSHLNKIDISFCYYHLCRQMKNFIHTMGRPPDFIDGHQHIHHLPFIRKMVLRLYKKYMKTGYLRSVSPAALNLNTFLKSMFLGFTGGFYSRYLWKKNGVVFNQNFSGLRTFKEKDFSSYFFSLLKNASNGTLIMCHPGFKSLSMINNDCISSARYQEYKYFTSSQFLEDLKSQNIEILMGSDIIAHSIK